MSFSSFPLIIDSFCGGGGASTGIEAAIGRPIDIAINHSPYAIACHLANHPNTRHLCQDIFEVDPREAAIGRPIDIAINHSPYAIACHLANHPNTRHLCQDIFEVDPREAAGGRPVGLAWFSPDCTHFSRAKGGKPRDKKIRSLAWVVIRWAALVHPRVICLENVPEFRTWGPLGADNKPIKSKIGQTFRTWLAALAEHGYKVEYRELIAADYGAPTTRKRLFLIARNDGRPIVWPEPTHGPGRPAPWCAAAECIDWSLPCPSIFDRKKPLADATLRRIAAGIRKYVIESPSPYIVTYYGDKGRSGDFRGQSVAEPLKTQTAENRHALVVPSVTKFRTGSIGSDLSDPLPTITSGGQCARPAGAAHALGLMAATLMSNNTNNAPHAAGDPLATVTGGNRHFAVASYLSKFYGTSVGSPLNAPMPTATSTGNHLAEVRAFLVKYYKTGIGQPMDAPIHTLTGKDRLGLVVIEGHEYQISDIGLRMLQPRELALAQGFPASYILPGSKAQQTHMIGNSVCPPVAQAIVRANYADIPQQSRVFVRPRPFSSTPRHEECHANSN